MSDKYTATGSIYHVGATKEVGAKGFKKREVVLRLGAETKWPQLVAFEATGDGTSDLDGLMLGDEVRLHFDLQGREWAGPNGTKFFTTLKVWKVERTRAAAQPTSAAAGVDDQMPF